MRLAVIGCVLLLLAGCHVSYTGIQDRVDRVDLTVGRTTKREVLEALGVPDRVFYFDKGQILSFKAGAGRGMSAGIRWWGLGFRIGHFHSEFDTLEVTFDEHDKVTGYQVNRGWPGIGYHLWPFGS